QRHACWRSTRVTRCWSWSDRVSSTTAARSSTSDRGIARTATTSRCGWGRCAPDGGRGRRGLLAVAQRALAVRAELGLGDRRHGTTTLPTRDTATERGARLAEDVDLREVSVG